MVQLFCIPYAGGSANIYSQWRDKLKGTAEVVPLEYAGHGKLFCEEFASDIGEVAKEMCHQIESNLKEDYVIYGHSMGCLVAYETVLRLTALGGKLPRAVILSATRPPHLLCKDKDLGSLSRDALMQHFASMGQMEREVFEEPELYEIISEIMYADVQICTKYAKQEKQCLKLDVPFLVFTGEADDEAPPEDMEEWKKYTNKDFILKVIKGDHFFAFKENGVFWEHMRDYLIKVEKSS